MISIAQEVASNAKAEEDLADASTHVMFGGGGLTVIGLGGYFTLTAANVATGIPFCVAVVLAGTAGAAGGWMYRVRAQGQSRYQSDLAQDLSDAAARLRAWH